MLGSTSQTARDRRTLKTPQFAQIEESIDCQVMTMYGDAQALYQTNVNRIGELPQPRWIT